MQRLVSGYSATNGGIDGAAQRLGAPILGVETRGWVGSGDRLRRGSRRGYHCAGRPSIRGATADAAGVLQLCFCTMLELGYDNGGDVVVARRQSAIIHGLALSHHPAIER